MNRLFNTAFVLPFTLLAICCANPTFAQNETTEQANPTETPESNIQMIQSRGEVFTTRANPIALPLPQEKGVFHFAIYGDRTGGDQAGLKFLRQAVTDTNLMDPDLVMTVGDLIQGYNRTDSWLEEMKEFKTIMARLNMSWFPVAGNHDIYWDFRDRNRPNTHHEANYEKHFGPLWYSFQHKNCGFIVLFSDEGNPETGEKGFNKPELQNVSAEQMAFLEQALKRQKTCDQVFVFVHHPRWLGRGYQGSNWPEVHKKMVAAGNVKAVFGGHIHQMTYSGPVDGIEYFTLATTGGHLASDAHELGYLHHFNVVTVRKDSFTMATLPVGSVIDPKTFKPDFLDDVQVVKTMRPVRAGDRLSLNRNGSVSGEYDIRITNPGAVPIEVTLTPNASQQWQVLPDHQHVIIPPNKSSGMTFRISKQPETADAWSNFSSPTLQMNVDYLHSSARVRLAAVSVPVDLTLSMPDETFATDLQHCLSLRGTQSRSRRRPTTNLPNDSLRIDNGQVNLPQGPFTIEAWINPSNLSQSRGIVAKTQSSEYALFLHEGRAQFDVHLDGKYVSPESDERVALNEWTHVAGVYDGEKATLYVNGKPVKSLPASGKRTTNQLPIYIGADPDGAGNPTREFAGLIDEVRISKGVRYTAEFQPGSRLQTDERTLALFHLDQTFGPFLPSDSANNIMATKIGQAQTTPRKK